VSLPSSTSLEMSSVIFIAHPRRWTPMARRYHELRRHVRFWHLTDIEADAEHVRFWG